MKLEKVKKCVRQHARVNKEKGTPLYVYDGTALRERANLLLGYDFLTPRYAVKANPHPEIIALFDSLGLHFDASSSYEAEELIAEGIAPEKISLSSQQPAHNLPELLRSRVQYVATSMRQLELVSEAGYKGNIAVRLNPGMGAGHNNRTTTGGVTSSFGIWHEYIPQVKQWQETSGCNIDRIHVHIGSGADPAVWRSAMQRALELVAQFDSVTALDIGGGYKIARMPDEQDTDMQQIIAVFKEELDAFYASTGRVIRLEIEPGTWLVGNAGVLVAEIVDIVDTGKDGFTFLRLNTGLNDLLRPSMYGAQHDMEVLNDTDEQVPYVVVGHNCESGDILTTKRGDPEIIEPRMLRRATVGDLLVIFGAGAYCASMRAKGYNSYEVAKEVFVPIL